MCPLDELCFIHICHNRMNSTALHSMDINYSVVTKPKRNKHVLLKDLNVKQLNLWKTFWENRIYMQLCFNHPFVEYKPSTAKVIKHRHTILLTQVQETCCSIKFSCLTFFNMSVPFPKWWNNSEFQKTDGLCTISKASCLYSQCSLLQPILLRGQIKYIEEKLLNRDTAKSLFPESQIVYSVMHNCCQHNKKNEKLQVKLSYSF